MNILIAGLGALGTVHACLLKKAGHTVHALTRKAYLSALRDGRVRVSGIWGEHEAVLDGIHASIEPLRSVALDLVILTVKAFDTAAAIGQLKPLVGPDTLVLVAQNGYGNYETVAAAVGRERTLLARVIFGVKLHAPGTAEVTVIADATRIGQPEGAVAKERIEHIASAIDAAGIPAAAAQDVAALLWDKILYNAALNPLGAILECSYGELAENPGARTLMDAVIDEAFLVAGAHGIRLAWRSADDYRRHFYGKLVPPTARHYPSMYYDIKAGKRIEIDALNGAIVRLAREKGLAAPVNETIALLIAAKGLLSSRRPDELQYPQMPAHSAFAGRGGSMTYRVRIAIGLLLACAGAYCITFPFPFSSSADGSALPALALAAAVIPLPPPDRTGTVPLEAVLAARRSVRSYGGQPLTLTELSQLLWAAQGVTNKRGFRTAPSAGALYPLEVYVIAAAVKDLAAGVYRYQPPEHRLLQIANGDIRGDLAAAALGQSPFRSAPAVIVIAADERRTTGKYGERGVRYVHLEAGHAAQNIALQAVALGLGTVMIGAFSDEAVTSLLQAPRLQPLYLIPVGRN